MSKANYCVKHSEVVGKIIAVIDDKTLSTVEKFHPLFDFYGSLGKLEIGDFVVDDDSDPVVFDKFGNPKDRYYQRISAPSNFRPNSEETLMMRDFIKPKKLKFRIIQSDDDLKTAKMFDSDAKKGSVIMGIERYSQKLVSKEDFEAYYTILN